MNTHTPTTGERISNAACLLLIIALGAGLLLVWFDTPQADAEEPSRSQHAAEALR